MNGQYGSISIPQLVWDMASELVQDRVSKNSCSQDVGRYLLGVVNQNLNSLAQQAQSNYVDNMGQIDFPGLHQAIKTYLRNVSKSVQQSQQPNQGGMMNNAGMGGGMNPNAGGGMGMNTANSMTGGFGGNMGGNMGGDLISGPGFTSSGNQSAGAGGGGLGTFSPKSGPSPSGHNPPQHSEGNQGQAPDTQKAAKDNLQKQQGAERMEIVVTSDLEMHNQKADVIDDQTTIVPAKAGKRHISFIKADEGFCFSPEEAFEPVDQKSEFKRHNYYMVNLQYDQVQMEYIERERMKEALETLNSIIKSDANLIETLHNIELKGIGNLRMLIAKSFQNKLLGYMNKYTFNGCLSYQNIPKSVELTEWEDVVQFAQEQPPDEAFEPIMNHEVYGEMIQNIIRSALFKFSSIKLLDPNNPKHITPIALAMDRYVNQVNGSGYLSQLANLETSNESREKFFKEFKEHADEYSFLAIPEHVVFTNLVPYEALMMSGSDSIINKKDTPLGICNEDALFTKAIRQFAFGYNESESENGLDPIGRRVYVNIDHNKGDVLKNAMPVTVTLSMDNEIVLSAATQY